MKFNIFDVIASLSTNMERKKDMYFMQLGMWHGILLSTTDIHCHEA